MKKRLLSALLTFCMVLTMLPVSALAVDGDVVDYNGSNFIFTRTEHSTEYVQAAQEGYSGNYSLEEVKRENADRADYTFYLEATGKNIVRGEREYPVYRVYVEPTDSTKLYLAYKYGAFYLTSQKDDAHSFVIFETTRRQSGKQENVTLLCSADKAPYYGHAVEFTETHNQEEKLEWCKKSWTACQNAYDLVSMGELAKPGKTITIQVFVNGELVTNDDMYIDVASAMTNDGADRTDNFEANVNNTTGDYKVDYTYEKYDCADIQVTVTPGTYVLQGVSTTVIYTTKTGDQIIVEDGTVTLDNVQGGSTISIYLRAPYKVAYDVSDNPDYVDNATYIVEADVEDTTAWENYPKKDMPTKQVTWHNGDLKTSIELKELPDGEENENVTGWYTNEECTGTTYPTAGQTTVDVNTVYTTATNGTIHFYHKVEDTTAWVNYVFQSGTPNVALYDGVNTQKPSDTQAAIGSSVTPNSNFTSVEETVAGTVYVWTFQGWYTDEAMTEANKVTASVEVVSDGITFYGKWTRAEKGKVTITVNYKDEDGASLTAPAGADTSVEIYVGGNYNLLEATYAPKNYTSSGKNYVHVSTEGSLFGTNVRSGVTITLTYALDEWNDSNDTTTGGDGIPDKYQAKVTYKVEGGTWKNTTDIITQIYTLQKYENSSWTDTGVTLSNFPTDADVVEGDNYIKDENSGWANNEVPSETVVVSTVVDNNREKTYTYELTKKAPALTVTKEANPSTVEVGNSITYKITVKNTGNTTLSNIKVTDTLWDGVRVTSVNNDENLSKGAYSIKELGRGEEGTITYTYTPQNTGVVENTAKAETTTVPSASGTSEVIKVTVTEKEIPAPTIDDLLNKGILVTVECNSDTAVLHDAKQYVLSEEYRNSVSGPVENSDGTYTFTVSNDAFVNRYNEDGRYTGNDAHSTDDDGVEYVTLAWDKTKESWYVQSGSVLSFKVKCSGSTTPDAPEKEEIPIILRDKLVLVKCMYSDPEHTLLDQTYAIILNTYEVYEPQQVSDGSWICEVEIKSDDYVKAFIDDTGHVIHVLAGPNTQTVTLTWEEETGNWRALGDDVYAATFEVTCDPSQTGELYQITGFSKELVTDPTEASRDGVTYPDENGIVTIPYGGTVTLLYRLTVTGDPGAQYIIKDEEAQPAGGDYYMEGTIPESGEAVVYVTKTFDASDITGGKLVNTALVEAGDQTEVTGDGEDTEEVTAEEETGDIAPDVIEALLKYDVVCTTNPEHNESGLPLKSGTYISEVNKDNNTCEVKISNIKAYIPDGHELDQAETQYDSITLLWNGSKWIVNGTNDTFKFYVKCQEDQPEDPTYSITGFTKDLVTEATQDWMDGYDFPENGVVTIPNGGSVTLLYKLTVTGEAGAEYAIEDDGAVAVNGSTLTGTIPNSGEAVVYVSKTFDASDMTADGKLINTASVTAGDNTDVQPGEDEATEEVDAEEEGGEPPIDPAGPFYLTYDANGGNQSNVPVDNRAYYQGDTAYLENDTDELDDELGYHSDDVVFVGWSRNDQYSMSNPATREPNTITFVTFADSNITVYAVWAEDDNNNGIPDYDEEEPEQPEDPDDEEEDENTPDPTYAVFYHPGYGTDNRELDRRYEEGDEVEVLDNEWFEREGYTFIGWSTQINADSVTFLPEDIFDMPDHDVHLYAQWLRDEIGPEDTGVANWLNTTDHIAYLTGYPGGTFGPNNSMTRAEVAQMFYALLNNKNVTITATFPDVPADAWYATAVNTLASLGMVSGDADGNFRPNDPITRAEFCVIALAFAYEPESYSCSFTDVSVNDWFYTYVAQAASYGWIGGYADGSFGPNDLITRAQVTTIVNNMLGREADRSYVNNHADTLVQFNDLTSIHWAYYDIMEAVNEHEYTRTYGTEDWVE